jgi:hypothetical protein
MNWLHDNIFNKMSDRYWEARKNELITAHDSGKKRAWEEAESQRKKAEAAIEEYRKEGEVHRNETETALQWLLTQTNYVSR